MKQLHFSIAIQAPKARVHQLMLADKTYREWTSAFAEGSCYHGSWDKGSQILFGNADPNLGLKVRVSEHKPAEFISLEWLEFKQEASHAAQPLPGGIENYRYSEIDGKTTLQVELKGVPDEWTEYLEGSWPQALNKLKEICERA
jgi:hypothetical protein